MMKTLHAALLVGTFAVGTTAANAADVTGAGSSFVAPVIAKWADAYNKATGSKINYQSVGSGAGLQQIEANTVDFGASDAPLKPEELKAKGLVQFPTIIGGIVPVVNLAGVAPGQLRLNGAVLAEIYLGKLVKWDAPQIKALNPSVNLPDTPIAVVRRADGSGTTFNFTDYLAKVSPEWKGKVGIGTTVVWPVGLGGKGNEGVANYVQRLSGAIGYVEYAYAKQGKLAYALLQNSAGAYPLPSTESFRAAAAGAEWTKNNYYVIITDQPGKDAWPIAASTFILLHRQQTKPGQSTEVVKFFDWAYTNGARAAEDLDYVPLPDSLVTTIRSTWASDLKDASDKPLMLH
jgi:phosphate transport system substrate-binding protein